MAEVRECAQCGAAFIPRREHARFCSGRCRMEWNRDRAAPAPSIALDWSITAMTEATERLARATAWNLPRVAAAVSEATWQVTIVDATLIRYYPDVYDDVMASQPRVRQRLTEETLAGLRYVRNRMGYDLDPVEFIRPAPGHRGSRVTAWTWSPLPEPALERLPPHGREWEIARYRAYQARLVGRDIARTFALTAAFLEQTAAEAAGTAPADAHAAQ